MMIRPNLFELTRRAACSFNVASCALALASCATVTRIPYTQQEQTAAVIPGIPGARIWADDPAIATVRRHRGDVPPGALARSPRAWSHPHVSRSSLAGVAS